MGTVLLVEDDLNIAQTLKFNLEQNKLQCVWARTLGQAKVELERLQIDLILMDIGLPDGSGLDLCRSLRATGFEPPIILLTARPDEESLLAGFDGGANDYVRKPFSNRELIARVNANIGRASPVKTQVVYKGLKLDTRLRQCSFGEIHFRLNRKQFEILHYLIANAGRVVSRDSLLRYLGRQDEVFDRTIDAHISQLRKKLKDMNIEGVTISSIYGLGYTIDS